MGRKLGLKVDFVQQIVIVILVIKEYQVVQAAVKVFTYALVILVHPVIINLVINVYLMVVLVLMVV